VGQFHRPLAEDLIEVRAKPCMNWPKGEY